MRAHSFKNRLIGFYDKLYPTRNSAQEKSIYKYSQKPDYEIVKTTNRKEHFLKIFFPEQKEGGVGGGEWREDYIVEKLSKLARVLVTSFDKFHHLCNLYSFSLCFFVQ